MRLTKIYTKMGDTGSTMLASGEFVAKTDPRIEAYGTVDELNAFVAVLVDQLHGFGGDLTEIIRLLTTIQNELFDVGGELATPFELLNTARQQVVTSESITRLENEIDTMNENLAPLKNFVIPGGHPAVSAAHVCRTVCRRAERHIVLLSNSFAVRSEVRIYINRLSDWFFVVGRDIGRRVGATEVLWKQARKLT